MPAVSAEPDTAPTSPATGRSTTASRRGQEVLTTVAAKAGLDVRHVTVRVVPGAGASLRPLRPFDALLPAPGPRPVELVLGAERLAGPAAEAAVAHELGHLAEGHDGYGAPATIAEWVLMVLTPVVLVGGCTGQHAAALGVAWVLVLAYLAGSRRQERRADEYAARLGYAEALAADFRDRASGRRWLAWTQWLSSHPRREDRVRRLEAWAHTAATAGRPHDRCPAAEERG